VIWFPLCAFRIRISGVGGQMVNKANSVAFDLSQRLWPHRRNLPLRFHYPLEAEAGCYSW